MLYTTRASNENFSLCLERPLRNFALRDGNFSFCLGNALRNFAVRDGNFSLSPGRGSG